MGDFVFDVGGGVEFRRATDDDSLESIASLAETIWREHYGSILSRGQINYMLENFQSFKAMKKQIANEGYTYFGIYAPSLRDDKVAPSSSLRATRSVAWQSTCETSPSPSLRGSEATEAISQSAPPSSLRGASVASNEAISESVTPSSSQSAESTPPSSLRDPRSGSWQSTCETRPSPSLQGASVASNEAISKNLKPLCGYFAYNLKEDSLFLSKLYLLQETRGQGIARKAIDFLSKIAKESKLQKITLTVNKYNTNTIAAYTKMGFVTYHTESVPIGNNYFMDDYFMEKIL